jgi:hypothetical protein
MPPEQIRLSIADGAGRQTAADFVSQHIQAVFSDI